MTERCKRDFKRRIRDGIVDGMTWHQLDLCYGNAHEEVYNEYHKKNNGRKDKDGEDKEHEDG